MSIANEVRIPPNGLFGQLRMPNDLQSPRGCCLFVHGLTRGQGQFERAADMLCEQGFASLRFDSRGRGQSEGVFTLRNMIDDIRHGLSFLRSAWPSTPLAMVARGEGAYCSIMATWRVSMSAKIFWAPIFYPRTSRERQGHMHEFRQRGFAVLRLSPEEQYWMGKEFLNDLDAHDDAWNFVNSEDRLLVVHPAADAISPVEYVNEFLDQINPRLVIPAALELLDARPHPHVDKNFPSAYETATLRFLGEVISLSKGSDKCI